MAVAKSVDEVLFTGFLSVGMPMRPGADAGASAMLDDVGFRAVTEKSVFAAIDFAVDIGLFAGQLAVVKARGEAAIHTVEVVDIVGDYTVGKIGQPGSGIFRRRVDPHLACALAEQSPLAQTIFVIEVRNRAPIIVEADYDRRRLAARHVAFAYAARGFEQVRQRRATLDRFEFALPIPDGPRRCIELAQRGGGFATLSTVNAAQLVQRKRMGSWRCLGHAAHRHAKH